MTEQSSEKQGGLNNESPRGGRSRQEDIDMKLRDVWSIGIYTGDSPLHLSSPSDIQNPVLTYKEISDIPAAFVADPFMIVEQGIWYMFFEVMNRETIFGEIGLAVSNDGLHWEYRQIVLKEDYHLSYPYIFKREDDYYMIPETLTPNCIRLYRAVSFPTQWSCVGSLINGRYADASILRFNGKWWLFACPSPSKNDMLRLYFSDDLMGPWQEHPKSPIVEENPQIARPGGRLMLWNDKLIRYAQDCYPNYGTQVRAFEIKTLTPTDYSEEEFSESPIISTGNAGWNNTGMHHIDPYPTPQGRWIASVDGY